MPTRNDRIRLAILALACLWAFFLTSDQQAFYRSIEPQVSHFTAVSLVEPITETRDRRIAGEFNDVHARIAKDPLESVSLKSTRHLEELINDTQRVTDYHASMNFADKKAFCDRKATFWARQATQNGTLTPTECNQMKDTCGVTSCDASVDLVYLWVDGNDPEFLQKKNATLHNMLQNSNDHDYNTKALRAGAGVSVNRFRDFDELRYSLRSVHENAPWARRIFIVTDEQTPACVEDEAEHPNLRLRTRMVSHQDLFSYVKVEKPKYPLYNSIAIQTMVHAIPTLSSPFMMMDDDIFFGRSIPNSYIFDYKDSSKAILHVHMHRNETFYEGHPYLNILFNSIKLIASKFPNSTEVADVVQSRSYTLHEHGPILLHPEDGFRLWELCPDEMLSEVNHPFRHSQSTNVQTLYRFLSIAETDRYSIQPSSAEFQLIQNKDSTYRPNMKKLRKGKWKGSIPYMVCLNDDLTSEDPYFLGNATNTIKASLGEMFPSIS